MATKSTLRRLPEWAPQKETILSWPGLEGTLKDEPERLAKATQEVSALAQAIAHFQPVTILVGKERQEESQVHFDTVETPFPITLHPINGSSLDLWARDFTPTFVLKNNSLAGLDWNFNGLGGKYPTPTTSDFTKTYLKNLQIERIETSIVTEGSALETDGEGTLLITESSVINDNRNPGKSRNVIEAELKRTLGVKKIIWIPGREKLDSADSHIDALVRFIKPGLLLLSKANEIEQTDWTTIYNETLEIVSNTTDANGRPFEIIEVEEPSPELFPTKGWEDNRPVRSYANYVLTNGGIIVPQFGDPAHDAAGIITFQRLYGDERRIFPVLLNELPELGGGIHRATQEIPREIAF